MKTTSIHIAGALILTICLGVSCQKEQPAQIGDNSPVTVMATISDAPDTKVTYTEDGNKLKSAWAAGDHIVGWDEDGNKLELEIASADRITSDGTAIFTTVTGSANLPASGNIYMIYAPGMHYSDVGDKTLTVDLRSQAEGVIPALMMATGMVNERQISLDFTNQMSIVMVKNPKFPEAANSLIGGLILSGENVNTSVTFDIAGGSLTMTPSVPGSIIKPGAFTTGADGSPVSDVTFYFAVPPSTVSREVSVSSLVPDGYAFYAQGTFVKNECYKIDQPAVNRFQYNITTKSYEDGSTFITSPAGRAPWGDQVTITPQPAQHWEFVSGSYKVTMDGSEAGIALLDDTFTMPQGDVTVGGEFRKVKYTLTSSVNSATMGSVAMKYTSGGAPITSGTAIEWGPNITVTPTANTYYVLDKIKIGTSDITTARNFNMPKANTTVDVTFKKCSYTINKGPQTNGTITVAASSQWGETVTVTATPNSNYSLDKMTYTDEGGTAQTIYFNSSNVGTFSMPKSTTTVNVTFKENDTGTIGSHNYVKIGNTKWATTNIGATNPQDYGNWYSWGDISTKTEYSQSEYKSPAKDIPSDIIPTSGNDAARANWGSTWRMPTVQDFRDLAAACGGASNYNTSTRPGVNTPVGRGIYWCTNYGGVTGCLFCDGTYKLFFPVAGNRAGTHLIGDGSYGLYWSSSFYSSDSAYYLHIYPDNLLPSDTFYRYIGMSIRPVAD